MLFNNLNFLFLQLGNGCVSNCSGCSRKNEKYLIGDIFKIRRNIDILISRNIFSNNLLIYNIDYFDIDDSLFNFILSKKQNFKKIWFHTNFRYINYKKIDKSINFLYQRELNNNEIIFFIKFLLKSNIKNCINCVFWYNDERIKINFLKILSKYFSFTFSNNTFKIGNIFIKLYNKSGKREKLNKCFFDNSIKTNLESVIFGDSFNIGCLEILLNGDIRAHEPPCGFGDIIISNINKQNKEILNDFKIFNKYIKNFININNNISQEMVCNKCIKLKYNYE